MEPAGGTRDDERQHRRGTGHLHDFTVVTPAFLRGRIVLAMTRNTDIADAFERALAISESMLGPGHPDVAELINDFADENPDNLPRSNEALRRLRSACS